MEYFRAVPARFFAWLGGIVFVGGWAMAVYSAWFADDGENFTQAFETFRIQTLMSQGILATIAAGILWAVAAFLWVRVLPALPDDEVER